MNSTPTPTRAVVFGGGGSTGNAWLIGVVAGLRSAGLDATDADLAIGTSAGSTTAVQLSYADAAELYAATVAAVPPPRPAGVRPDGPPPINHLERTNLIIAGSRDAADMRRRIGAAALELDAEGDGSSQARWREITAARLPDQRWPRRRLLIPVVDARTGEPVVLDRDSGIDLADAIAASTSSGLPHRIGDARYIDGGYRRNENADLAAGMDRVLVLSPFRGRTRHPLEWGMQLSAQVDELRAGGSLVETILPGEDLDHLFGPNAMNAALRIPAAEAGFAQGTALAPSLLRFWS